QLLASLPNGSALEPGQTPYGSTTLPFTLPLRAAGDAYIIVVTDARRAVDQFPRTSPSMLAQKFHIEPVLFADLVTSEVQAPSQAIHGSNIEVSYTVSNRGSAVTRGEAGNLTGWTDTVWLTRGTGRPQPGAGDILLGSRRHEGTLAPTDQPYHGQFSLTLPDDVASGDYHITVWADTYGSVVETSLQSNDNHDASGDILGNNVLAREIKVLGPVRPQPDLKVNELIAPGAAPAGEPYSFSYTVTNIGDPVPAGGKWADEVYLSDSPDFSQAMVLWALGRYEHVGPLGSGEPYSKAVTVTLPPSASGRYLLVRSQAQWSELNTRNNVAHTDSVVTPAPADLMVTGISVPPRGDSGEPVQLSYTVQNLGAAVWPGTEGWTDAIYISSSPVFDLQAKLLTTVQHDNAAGLGAGKPYSATVQATLPAGVEGPYYLYVRANALPEGQKLQGSSADALAYYRHGVYETNPANNMAQTSLVIDYKEAALKVESLKLEPANPQSGQLVTATWTVRNVGNRATRVNEWADGLYLTRGSSVSDGDYPLVDRDGEVEEGSRVRHIDLRDGNGRPRPLGVGESYTRSATFALPSSIEGAFKLVLKASTDLAKPSPFDDHPPSTIREGLEVLHQFDHSGNGAVLQPKNLGKNTFTLDLPITLATPPDLQVTKVTAPSEVTAGQLINVAYQVSNPGGDTPADQSHWHDLVYLSRDRNLDLSHDTLLGFVDHNGGLKGKDSYDVSEIFKVPKGMSGSYYVFVITNPDDGANGKPVVLGSGQDRNAAVAAAPLLVKAPPVINLDAVTASMPANAQPGQSFRVDYTVHNLSAQAAEGEWTDAVYLSQDGEAGPNDILLGRYVHHGGIAADGSYQGVVEAPFPALKEGRWQVIVRPDVYRELGRDAAAVRPHAVGSGVQVSVPELPVAVAMHPGLAAGGLLLYKVSVAAHQTLRVNLDADDTGNNELYIKYGEVPSSFSYDAAYSRAQSADQQAIIADTQAGDYYVLVRAKAAPLGSTPVSAPVTLRADLLPLSITRVTPDSGGTADGDHRWVSMDIEGAQFQAGALVKLSRPGMFEVQPARWQVLDATHIRAVFDLSHVPHGLYDLAVINPDGKQVVEAFRYMVDRAVDADVTIGIGGSDSLDPGYGGTYNVTLQNLGNTDAPFVRFDVGATNLGPSETGVLAILGLPYVSFSSNIGGQPPGRVPADSANTGQFGPTPADGTRRPDVPWAALNSQINTQGFNLTPGYAFDVANAGAVQNSFVLQTYPGLREWLSRDFIGLRKVLYQLHPDWQKAGLLDGGVADLNKIEPNLLKKFRTIDAKTGVNLDPGEMLSLSFRFQVLAAATPLSRDEFIAEQSAYAEKLRLAILADADASGPLQVLAANRQQWQQGWLAALEAGGILPPQGEAPAIRSQPLVLSLNTVLASGIVLSRAGDSFTTRPSLLDFFNKIQQWYGNSVRFAGDGHGVVAPIDYHEYRAADGGMVEAESPVADAPRFADYDAHAAHATHFQSLNVFAGGLAQKEYLRHIGLLDQQFRPVNPAALNLLQLIQEAGTASGSQPAISLRGPQLQTAANGRSYVPAGIDLPHTLSFHGQGDSGQGQIRIVTQLDPNLQPSTLRLGDLRIGDLNVHVPAGRTDFQGDFDFSGSKGYVLRVSAGIDDNTHTVTWLLQAIDPDTGEVITETRRGLLAPDASQLDAPPADGFVSYTVRP
ncbi:pre-peptidase C-terminal domain-containing protein, partial [Chitinimonas sp.]|uniref:pre-peptidase C-terminal domain-containing protein n=1 Tax=Chitinimonas sp. TaxID=1934313 RepID=UPI0035AFBEBB